MCDSSCVHSFALSIILVGTLLLTIFCSELIPDYSYSKDLKEVTCAIKNHTFIGNVCCEAAVTSMDHCESSYLYPCAIVTAIVDNNTASQKEVQLFKDFKSASRGGNFAWCSFFHCDSASYEERLEIVTKFTSEYGVAGSSHKCYQGNKDTTGETALLERVQSGAFAGALTVSIMLIIAGIIIIITMCLVDKRRDKNNIQTIPPSKENLKQGDEFDEDSDIETIDMNTTSTTLSVKSSKSAATNKSTPGSPNKHPNSGVVVEAEEKVSSI